MIWKDRPYWLKGLIIGVAILVLIQLLGIAIYLVTKSKCSGWCIYAAFWVLLPAVLIILILNSILSPFSNSAFLVPLMILGYALYPLIGALIGWIVGKILGPKESKN